MGLDGGPPRLNAIISDDLGLDQDSHVRQCLAKRRREPSIREKRKKAKFSVKKAINVSPERLKRVSCKMVAASWIPIPDKRTRLWKTVVGGDV